MSQKGATITQAANGFIVEVHRPPAVYEVKPEIDFEQYGKVLQNVLTKFKADPVLDEIEESNRQDPAPKPVKRKEPENNVHVFATFPEVAEFLEYHFAGKFDE